VALQDLPVMFALDRAGIVGADGPTHAGAYDIAYIRCIPNCSLLAPSDENECRQALTTAHRRGHPTAVRYPRGAGAGVSIDPALTEWPWGRGVVRRQAAPRADSRLGKRIAILAFGTLLHPALKAAEGLGAAVADMRFIKPLDADLVCELARSHDALVTVEEGCAMGGAGSAVLECLAAAGLQAPVLVLGLPDVFVEHGDPAKLLALCGLDAPGIERAIVQRFGARPALAAVNA
jgi:1-deoxy-D-xylulose-5-phosphate synthase